MVDIFGHTNDDDDDEDDGGGDDEAAAGSSGASFCSTLMVVGCLGYESRGYA